MIAPRAKVLAYGRDVRTPAQRGPIGNWLREERLGRGWSQDTARKNLARAGISASYSVYAEWESGTRVPSHEKLAALEGYFGTSPHTESPADATPAGLSELLRALTAQAEAITLLASRVDELLAQRNDLQEQIDFAREERRLLFERVAEAARDHAVLLGKVG